MYTISRLRKRSQQPRSGDNTGMMDAHSNSTFTPSGTGRAAWSESDLANAMSPNASGHRLSSGSPAASAGGTGILPGAFGSYSGKIGAAGSFGSVMGATGRLGEDSDSPHSGSRDQDGASQASLGKSTLTLKDGMGGRKPSAGLLNGGSWPSGVALLPSLLACRAQLLDAPVVLRCSSGRMRDLSADWQSSALHSCP